MSERGDTVRDELLGRLNEQLSIAEYLVGQAQTRAQATATSLTLVISIGSFIVASDSSVRSYITTNHLGVWLIIGGAGLALSLLLALVFSFPASISLSSPQAFSELKNGDPELYQPLDVNDPDVRALVAKHDAALIDVYKKTLSTNEVRGWVILAAQLLLVASIVDLLISMVSPLL